MSQEPIELLRDLVNQQREKQVALIAVQQIVHK